MRKLLMLFLVIIAMTMISNAQTSGTNITLRCAPLPLSDDCLLHYQCGIGLTNCQFDSGNCGGIGNRCTGGQQCSFGSCTCDVWGAYCGQIIDDSGYGTLQPSKRKPVIPHLAASRMQEPQWPNRL